MSKPLHGLEGLRVLKKQIDARTREAERLAAEAREREAAARREREAFALAVGPVTRLPERGRATPQRPRPPAQPLQRQRDEQAVLKESISDEMDIESLLETDAALAFRRPGIGPDVVLKLRRGAWVIQAQIDLHGLRRDEAREQLGAFLRDASRHGLRCVRVVHGKGNGSPGRQAVLKDVVRRWLVQKAEVMAFVQARAAEGGAGALVVLLGAVPAA
ncbi:Smr/MutS family protein [Rivibacter subsaxonicus]|uniref:DNA-nicking Smr family endonuclease n=1 Tax=Rivibacter subsaxonicus TaxID=457575 RepID=A0A4Q7W0X9_9BURK|nr:Smr/MutS family protein [Rivibacter subsaxonicus]RZU02892.1 DNA-nicking Smr family endonuclease [Rivibacter subsaxonicus]